MAVAFHYHLYPLERMQTYFAIENLILVNLLDRKNLSYTIA